MEEVAGTGFAGDDSRYEVSFKFFLLLFCWEKGLVPVYRSRVVVVEVEELFDGRGNDLRMIGKIIVERSGAAALSADDDETGKDPVGCGQISNPDVRNGQGPFRPSG